MLIKMNSIVQDNNLIFISIHNKAKSNPNHQEVMLVAIYFRSIKR